MSCQISWQAKNNIVAVHPITSDIPMAFISTFYLNTRDGKVKTVLQSKKKKKAWSPGVHIKNQMFSFRKSQKKEKKIQKADDDWRELLFSISMFSPRFCIQCFLSKTWFLTIIYRLMAGKGLPKKIFLERLVPKNLFNLYEYSHSHFNRIDRSKRLHIKDKIKLSRIRIGHCIVNRWNIKIIR